MVSGMTPRQFASEVARVTRGRPDGSEADPQLTHAILMSLIEDTLVEFGYIQGIAMIRTWRQEHE